MAGQQQSEFSNPLINWIDTRLPIFTMMQKEYGVFPHPRTSTTSGISARSPW